jgi:hypothetical protein
MGSKYGSLPTSSTEADLNFSRTLLEEQSPENAQEGGDTFHIALGRGLTWSDPVIARP